MRKIESFQMKKIYAIGHALGITGNGSEDELHVLVSGVTGKDSIKELSYQEAMAVIKKAGGSAGRYRCSETIQQKAEGTFTETRRRDQRTAEENLGFDVRTEETR